VRALLAVPEFRGAGLQRPGDSGVAFVGVGEVEVEVR
jgi:hypothetical protein